ncbi:MAG TPA: HD domain-containing protein [Euzebya sp.]|nr:HD domain-containing protein [Euzebya sp.]
MIDDTVHGQRLAEVVGRITQDDPAPGDLIDELMALRDAVEADPAVDTEAFLKEADRILVSAFGGVGPHRLSSQLLVDPEPPVLTERYAQAVVYAAGLHRDQRRKGTAIPYVAHLLGTSSFLLEQPAVDEDQAIAALLHDAIEDHPEQTDLETIARHFGPRVARIVADCSDADAHPKPPWRHRKVAYLEHLQGVTRSSLQVALADKLHNARAIVTDLETSGDEVWTRFNGPPVAQRWYYSAMAELFSRRLGSTLAQALQRTVERLTAHLPESLDLDDGLDRPEWVGTDSVTGAAADLLAAAWIVRTSPEELVQTGAQAWCTADGQWWIEQADTGDAGRPLVICIRPLEAVSHAA